MTTQVKKQSKLNTFLKRGAVVAVVGSTAVSTFAADAQSVQYPSLDFSSIPMAGWIASGMAFSVMAGMAFIGLAALTSVLRKSRGAVR